MGAPIGNKNAAGSHGMRKAYHRLSSTDKAEIRYHRKQGSLKTLRDALKTSKPTKTSYKRRRNAMLGYIKHIK